MRHRTWHQGMMFGFTIPAQTRQVYNTNKEETKLTRRSSQNKQNETKQTRTSRHNKQVWLFVYFSLSVLSSFVCVVVWSCPEPCDQMTHLLRLELAFRRSPPVSRLTLYCWLYIIPALVWFVGFVAHTNLWFGNFLLVCA